MNSSKESSCTQRDGAGGPADGIEAEWVGRDVHAEPGMTGADEVWVWAKVRVRTYPQAALPPPSPARRGVLVGSACGQADSGRQTDSARHGCTRLEAQRCKLGAAVARNYAGYAVAELDMGPSRRRPGAEQADLLPDETLLVKVRRDHLPAVLLVDLRIPRLAKLILPPRHRAAPASTRGNSSREPPRPSGRVHAAARAWRLAILGFDREWSLPHFQSWTRKLRGAAALQQTALQHVDSVRLQPAPGRRPRAATGNIAAELGRHRA